MRDAQISLREDVSLAQVESAVAGEFQRRQLPCPGFSLRAYGDGDLALFAQGQTQDDWCWIRVYEWPSNLDMNAGMRFACSIESRGDDFFPAIVAFSILKVHGWTIFDDAGYAATGDELTADQYLEKLRRKFPR